MNGKKAKRIRGEAKLVARLGGMPPGVTERIIYKFFKDIYKGKDMESAKYHFYKRAGLK